MRNTIREERGRRRFTQEDLARLVGVTRQTIISLEQGRYNPSLELAFRLARVFNLRIEDLFMDEEDRT